MNRKQADMLERCIKLLESGGSLQECFDLFPNLSPEARRMLEAASAIVGLGVNEIPENGLGRSRVNFLARASELSEKNQPSPAHSNFLKPVLFFQRMSQRFFSSRTLVSRIAIIIGIAAMLVIFSGGLIITSAKSLPGDTLYPVKRVVEDLSINLMPDKDVRTEYENNYSQERVEEINQLFGLKRSQSVSFIGVVQSMNGEEWLVSGVEVMVSSHTALMNLSKTQSIEVGSIVEVEGTTNGQGWVVADEIHLYEFEMSGQVELISSRYWKISGIQLYKNADTFIDSGIQEGDQVRVTVRSTDDRLYALVIHQIGAGTEIPEIAPSSTSVYPSPAGDRDIHETIGTLEGVSKGYWTISGQRYYLSTQTHFSEHISVGNIVNVKYLVGTDGSYLAVEIERVESDRSTDENSSTPTPEPNEELERTKIPTLTPTAREEDDHEATNTPSGSPTQNPITTPTPTEDD